MKQTNFEVSVADLRQNLASYINKLKSPIIVKVHGKAVAIISPVTDEEKLYQSMRNGEISYDDYKRKMMGVGYQNLVDGKVLVRPSDIIGSEKVEIEKEKVRIEGSKFFLDAARYWASRGDAQFCIKCGHMMVPEEDYKQLKVEEAEAPKQIRGPIADN